jgi:hypothetical protein
VTQDLGLKPPTAHAMGEAVFNERRFVEALIQEDVLRRLEGRTFKSPSERLFCELLARVHPWIMTLGRLANASDFQAVIGCDRALFELTVDLTLMRFAKADYPPEKMLAWDESAKLKACHAIERHFSKRGAAVPQRFQAQMTFINRNEGPITALRAKYFRLDKNGKPRHPARWTDATLEADAMAAHAATPKAFEWPVDLEAFYATRYPPICWNVHGSGAAGMRFIPEANIPLLGAQAMVECLDFAVRCAMLVLIEFGLFGATAKTAFVECQRKRTAILNQILGQPEPSSPSELLGAR